ncbi:MAG: S41 family peptidase [Anaerovoracaceae bacterium]
MKRIIPVILTVTLIFSVCMSNFAYAASSAKALAASIKVTLEAANTDEGIKLTWKSTNNKALSGYQVFKQTGDNSDKLVATIKNGGTTWTDTDVIPQETYSYDVRGFITDGSTRRFTNCSNQVSIKCAERLSHKSIRLNLGDTAELTLIGVPDEDIASGIIWTSKNPAIASVSEGVIAGISIGKTTVSAKYNGNTFNCVVEVYNREDYPEQSALMTELNEEKELHAELDLFNIDFSYLTASVEGSSDALTNNEIKKLMKEHKGKSTLTYKEAKYDIETYFNAYKYGYALYNYYGESKFEKAKNACLKAIKGKTKITKKELTNILYKNSMFMVDGHCGIGGKINGFDTKNDYEYYYSGIYFSKDEKGYYKKYSGKKYYFESCNEKNASIERTLTSSGKIKYQLILNLPASKVNGKSKVTLKTDRGAVKTLTASWKKEENAVFDHSANKFVRKGDVFYIDVNSFFSISDTQKYIDSADKAKKCEAVIFDIRGNGGGSFEATVEWIKRFTDNVPAIPKFRLIKNTSFNPYEYLEGEEMELQCSNLQVVDNNIPVYILIDDLTASAAEHSLCLLRSMKEVIVVGTNTVGAQASMERTTLYLPESGISFDMTTGASLEYNYEKNKLEIIDGKGYKPDVWCESKNALDYTYSFLKKQGYIIK